ncbi:MAG: hypothetical protein LUD72_11810 [Bacteroidales bacterium]|nr:hypothetical protein [Bacteroidales bacterium]
MKVDYSLVYEDLDNYKEVLTNPNSKYWVPEEKANDLVNELENAILELGDNYKNGTEVCPYPGLGQEMGDDGYAAIRNLRLKRFNNWIIVFIVNEEESQIRVTQLVHQGYPVGEPINLRKGDGLGYHFEGKQSKNPIQECLLWMVKLDCFNQYQVESLKEQGIF